MADPEQDETHHRIAQRFAAALPAVLHEDGGPGYPCAAENLSRTGVLLVGRLPVPAVTDVAVAISHPSGDLELRITGRIVFLRSGVGEEDTRLGLEFEDLTADQARLLEDLVSRVVEGMAPAALETLPKDATPEAIRVALAKVPVAHRRVFAARALVREREILRQDVEPTVLEALARNPHIVLPEIKSLLRRPDLLATTIDVIASDPRWFGDEEIKLMIATHPRVSYSTADRVAARLSQSGIDKLIRRSGLQPGVRQKLMLDLARKRRGG